MREEEVSCTAERIGGRGLCLGLRVMFGHVGKNLGEVRESAHVVVCY